MTTEPRQRAALPLREGLHRFVANLVEGVPPDERYPVATGLEADGMHLRITRSLDTATLHLRERYADDRDARLGLVASSKDKSLEQFGVPNGLQDTKRVKRGPWYGDPEDGYAG